MQVLIISACQDSGADSNLGWFRSIPSDVILLMSAKQGDTSYDDTYIISLVEMLKDMEGGANILKVHQNAVAHMISENTSYSRLPDKDKHEPILISTATKNVVLDHCTDK